MTALSTPARERIAVAVGGVPGSGKSTLGRAIAARIGAALLDLDTMTNPLLAPLAVLAGASDGSEFDPAINLDHPALRGSVREARYRCLRDTAAEVLSVGASVVLVAPFTAELASPDRWDAFCHQQGVPVTLIEVVVPPGVASRRRQERGLPRDRAAMLPLDVLDTGHPDLGQPDAGHPDLGQPDAGHPDLGQPHAHHPDTDRPHPGLPHPDQHGPATGGHVDYRADGTADADREAARLVAWLRDRRT